MLAREGARVALTDVNLKGAEKVAASINETHEGAAIALGITLPTPLTPRANYVQHVTTGNLVFIAGQISNDNGTVIAGKLGKDVDIETGQKAARVCAINLLAQLKAACGDLDRAARPGGKTAGGSALSHVGSRSQGNADLDLHDRPGHSGHDASQGARGGAVTGAQGERRNQPGRRDSPDH